MRPPATRSSPAQGPIRRGELRDRTGEGQHQRVTGRTLKRRRPASKSRPTPDPRLTARGVAQENLDRLR